MVLFAIVIVCACSFAHPATIALAAPPAPSNKIFYFLYLGFFS
ncbi:hypothetical protein BG20_I2587 [Candidatus Nitrosarchaeum limnium BG20]|uniref:Uncharacterized protein n=1 Tax=Candidatus Nitrosarchaeum limnium BG20 TaxID=859192 RepID=S2E022_9ARCH|nr:hypothetical protein BG20_I2587 [Candidatus Nitrosarchaeum limnium BG20]